jgi:RNase adapter protein RapZ
MNETAPPPSGPEEATDTPSASPPGRHPLVIVTGMSGAGRSTALKSLEDLGYEAVDNLPLSLLAALAGDDAAARHPIAIGIDVRTREFGVDALLEALGPLLRDPRRELRIVFLDCDDDLLQRRYTETRRRHPMAGDRPVMDGIRLERRRVSPLRDHADLVIDTSALNAADLRRLLHGHFALDAAPAVTVFVRSFSYRNGLPRDADLVIDVRFLRNPHYVDTLRPLTGLDPAVGAFVAADPDYPGFYERLTQWLLPLLPRYDREGKMYLTIAIGCTGGRHRSVFITHYLAQKLHGSGNPIQEFHRDVDRA